MNSIHPNKNPDEDLTRIIRLYDIIKRYELLVEHLLSNSDPLVLDGYYTDLIEFYERKIILKALLECNGSVSATARKLNLHLNTTTRYIERLDLINATNKRQKNITSKDRDIKATEVEVV